ncbi:MAG TPA: PTS sugar transporter subunit IIB [Tepidanaerobacter syntrophicus]|uniref:PTS sugar transporter subunit IIB n=1 Tax=Tepidanaerobacter syntrophicus TaxID=224999 RepID=UPI0017665E0B|nr:PTS sugar transporter subunit IIB [Tepidanaerobacter syntrophicus]HHV82872.1 PTS sugar transporter subunit IIB [Tepidanaerobacter syntrophicus]
MKIFKILSVCGSGTVTSSMVAQKLKDTMETRGIKVSVDTAKPTEALSLANSGKYDLIVHTSPLPKGDYGIPTISSASCLTGIGEDDFFEKVESELKRKM